MTSNEMIVVNVGDMIVIPNSKWGPSHSIENIIRVNPIKTVDEDGVVEEKSASVILLRVLGFTDNGKSIVTCEAEGRKIKLHAISIFVIYSKVSDGLWSVEHPNNTKVVDIINLPDTVVENYRRDKDLISSIFNHYNNDYLNIMNHKKDHYIKEVAAINGLSVKTVLKKLRYYFQSGFDDYSLLDKRYYHFNKPKYVAKDGKVVLNKESRQNLSEEQIDIIWKYIKRYEKNRALTIEAAYNAMLREEYVESSEEGANNTNYIGLSAKRPSFWQFYRFLKDNVSQEVLDAKRMERNKARNSKRRRQSSAVANVRYPGQIVEIDEFDSKVSLVSYENGEKTVGRANVYAMIDVRTQVIVAVGIAFNQNAFVGLTNMFMNLCDDKVEYCRRYGIEIDPKVWPSNFIPDGIRADRGSDFKSEDLLELCQKLNIVRNLEPPAMGSMKGFIENAFRQIQREESEYFYKLGLITKDHDSKHHEEAVMNIFDYTRFVILMVTKYNQHVLTKLTISPEMVDGNVGKRPIDLWEYYCDTVQPPRPINNPNAFYTTLMKRGTAGINKDGAHFLKRIYYIDKETSPDLYVQMYDTQSKRVKLDVLYDPRNMDYLYYIKGSELIALPMNKDKPQNAGYFHMSEAEVEYYNKENNRISREGKEINRELNVIGGIQVNQIISSALTPTKPSTKNMSETRKEEKTKVAQEFYSLHDRIMPPEEDSQQDSNSEAVTDDAADTTNDTRGKDDAKELPEDINDHVIEESLIKTEDTDDDIQDSLNEDDFLQSAIEGATRGNRL